MQSSRKWIYTFLLGALFWSPVTLAGTEVFYENSNGSPLVPLLQSAKKSIDIEIYEMNDPIVLGAVHAALNQGVKVRIVQEPVSVGAPCRLFEAASAQDSASCSQQKVLVSAVRRAGGQYVPFNVANLCGKLGSRCYQHGKMVIVDERTAILSTGNFNTTSLCDKKEHPTNCNRDYTVVTVDPNRISELKMIFEKDLEGTTYDLNGILSSFGETKITVSPISLKPMVDFINSANSSIQIQNQYLNDPDMNAAIIKAAKRGVLVEVMVASACSYGKPASSEVTRWTSIYTSFDRAGIKTRIFTRNVKVSNVSGYLHAKAILVDGKKAWVGSVNGSTMSISNNREYGIFLDEASEVAKLKTFLDSDFRDSNGESWQDSLACKHDPRPQPQTPPNPEFH